MKKSIKGGSSLETQSKSKIRIKMGQIEVEFEGSESFLKKELPELLAAVSNLYNKTSPSSQEADVDTEDKHRLADPPKIQLTTSNIAAKLTCNSGTDLIKAAAAHLAIMKNKNTFTRKEILSEMKSATNYFNKSYVGNLTPYLNTLIKQKVLNENATGMYSLTANSLKEMRIIIGQE